MSAPPPPPAATSDDATTVVSMVFAFLLLLCCCGLIFYTVRDVDDNPIERKQAQQPQQPVYLVVDDQGQVVPQQPARVADPQLGDEDEEPPP